MKPSHFHPFIDCGRWTWINWQRLEDVGWQFELIDGRKRLAANEIKQRRTDFIRINQVESVSNQNGDMASNKQEIKFSQKKIYQNQNQKRKSFLGPLLLSWFWLLLLKVRAKREAKKATAAAAAAAGPSCRKSKCCSWGPYTGEVLLLQLLLLLLLLWNITQRWNIIRHAC